MTLLRGISSFFLYVIILLNGYNKIQYLTLSIFLNRV